MLLRGQSVILLLAIRADRKRLVVLCGHEENATDSPNGCALDRAPGEMRAVRIVAVSAWLGLSELSPRDKGFELGDTFGPGLLLEPRETGKQVVRRALRRRDLRLLATVIRRHLAYRFHRARLWLHGDLRESRALDRALSVGSAISPEHRWEYFSRQMGTLAALYEPVEPYGGPVTLLRSTHDGPEDLRWRRWVTEDLQIVPVNVPHIGMEEEPGLRAAARVIEQVVVRAGA